MTNWNQQISLGDFSADNPRRLISTSTLLDLVNRESNFLFHANVHELCNTSPGRCMKIGLRYRIRKLEICFLFE